MSIHLHKLFASTPVAMLYCQRGLSKINSMNDLFAPSLLLGLAAAAVHANLQAAASAMSLMSSHALGRQRRIQQVLGLQASYIAGALASHAVLLAVGVFTASALHARGSTAWWLAAAGLNTLCGLLAALYYYRKQKGTSSWLPRRMAEYLSRRASTADSSAEAFSLGSNSVLAELPFSLGPLSVMALLLVSQDGSQQLAAISWYALLVSMPLLVIAGLIGSGYPLSRIQRWREANKAFLQYMAGCGSLLIAVFILAYFGTTPWE